MTSRTNGFRYRVVRRTTLRLAAAALATACLAGCTSETVPETVAGVPERTDAWPGASTTGVDPGVTLVPSFGLDVDEPGQLIEGLDIDGCVKVSANDVVIRNTRIRCAAREGAVVKVGPDVAAVLLENVEIDGLDDSNNGVGGSGYTLRRADVHNSGDGVRAGSNTVIEFSWIHHLSRTPDSHNDAIQSVVGTNIVIRGNNLQAYNEATDDFMNAAVFFGPDRGPIEDVSIYGNHLDGGNYTLQLNGESIEVKSNEFTRNHRYGPIRITSDSVVIESNYYVDGTPVP
jgi:hypothetical protein